MEIFLSCYRLNRVTTNAFFLLLPVFLCVASREFFKNQWFFETPLCVVLRWGWVFFEQTRIFSGIQLTTHFIEFFVVDTKRFVGNFVNVILM